MEVDRIGAHPYLPGCGATVANEADGRKRELLVRVQPVALREPGFDAGTRLQPVLATGEQRVQCRDLECFAVAQGRGIGPEQGGDQQL
jgi:hypothetical protein